MVAVSLGGGVGSSVMIVVVLFKNISVACRSFSTSVYFVASIGIKGGANVPSIFAVDGPGFPVLRFLVSDDMHAGWSKWSGIVIKRSMEVFMS